MIRQILAVAIAAAFVAASNSGWAQVGPNSIPKYGPGPEASKNRTHTKHGVGGNFVPEYGATKASTNKKVTNSGVGPNTMPSYPATVKP